MAALVSAPEAVIAVRALATGATLGADSRSVLAIAPGSSRPASVPVLISTGLHGLAALTLAALASLGLSLRAEQAMDEVVSHEPVRLVYLAQPGPGGGGGGGGLKQPLPPPKAEREGTHSLNSPLPARELPPPAPVEKPIEPPKPLEVRHVSGEHDIATAGCEGHDHRIDCRRPGNLCLHLSCSFGDGKRDRFDIQHIEHPVPHVASPAPPLCDHRHRNREDGEPLLCEREQLCPPLLLTFDRNQCPSVEGDTADHADFARRFLGAGSPSIAASSASRSASVIAACPDLCSSQSSAACRLASRAIAVTRADTFPP